VGGILELQSPSKLVMSCLARLVGLLLGELTGILIPLGDGCRNVNKNLPLFGSLLIRNCIPMS
jgi:hypothetical protein